MEELLDIFDADGGLKAVKSRSLAHSQGLWHKSVHVWIVNSQGEILVQKRSALKKFFPNVWDCAFAGHISHGESSITTVVREGKEELGLDIDLSKLKYLFTNKESIEYGEVKNNEFVDIYIYESDINISKLSLQIEEVSDVKWIKFEEFLKMLNSNGVLHHGEKEYKVLEEYFKNNLVMR